MLKLRNGNLKFWLYVLRRICEQFREKKIISDESSLFSKIFFFFFYKVTFGWKIFSCLYLQIRRISQCKVFFDFTVKKGSQFLM